jgi:spermidine synthase
LSRWELIDSANIPGGGELRLLKRQQEYVIRIAGEPGDLMSSRTHGSEDALGELACEALSGVRNPRVLIGGLGMGFTLTAALKALPADAEVVVAELIPEVVDWNRDYVGFGDSAAKPLDDRRVQVLIEDVATVIRDATEAFDAIALDVDNGPEGLTHSDNEQLYSREGLAAAYRALRPKGVLTVWSAAPAPVFVARLKEIGFRVDEHRVRAHRGKGARHLVWSARRLQ